VCDVMAQNGGNLLCELLAESGKTVDFEVLTESGQSVDCKVLIESAHCGMGLIFHQAKPRWTRREEDSKSSVLDLCLGMGS